MLRALTQHTPCQGARNYYNQGDSSLVRLPDPSELSPPGDGTNTVSDHVLVIGADNLSLKPDEFHQLTALRARLSRRF
jgi:hypothetical protein